MIDKELLIDEMVVVKAEIRIEDGCRIISIQFTNSR